MKRFIPFVAIFGVVLAFGLTFLFLRTQPTAIKAGMTTVRKAVGEAIEEIGEAVEEEAR